MDPVVVDFQRGYEVQRWRVIGNLFMAIPHLIVAYALQAVAGALSVITFLTILFTKQIPEGIFNTIVMISRYQWRLGTFVLFMRNEYPPFAFDSSAADPGGDPATFAIVRQDEYKRLAPLYKWFLAIPHFIVLCIFGIGAAAVIVIAWFAVLFTGKWPTGMRDFVINVQRYSTRVSAYCLLRDEYPTFGLG